MFHTDFGFFDGDSWEAFCQKCLKLRYREDGYQPIEAHFGGDLGIEGFTRSGIVFQCYCPDENYDPNTLYEHQRDKITRDLKKLISNKAELVKYLGKTKIKKWIFLTPKSHHKRLVLHCIEKRDEYRNLKLDHLHEEFDVLVHDIDFFGEEAPIVLKMTERRINIATEGISEESISLWAESEEQQVKNAIRKLAATFPAPRDEKVNELVLRMTDKRIKEYLKGTSVLRRLEDQFPDQYERFMKVIDDIESDVEDMCAYPAENNKKLFDEIQKQVEERLTQEFGQIFDSLMISDLKKHVISDWLMRCPIDFND